MLEKDPLKRISAKEILRHPFLSPGQSSDADKSPKSPPSPPSNAPNKNFLKSIGPLIAAKNVLKKITSKNKVNIKLFNKTEK